MRAVDRETKNPRDTYRNSVEGPLSKYFEDGLIQLSTIVIMKPGKLKMIEILTHCGVMVICLEQLFMSDEVDEKP